MPSIRVLPVIGARCAFTRILELIGLAGAAPNLLHDNLLHDQARRGESVMNERTLCGIAEMRNSGVLYAAHYAKRRTEVFMGY
jgi:hypothetical protein